jgi:hypothetical protein
MLRKLRSYFAAIGLVYLCSPATFAAPMQDTRQTKLAVLKLTFTELSLQEQDRLRTTLYDNLSKDKRILLMTETEVRQKLVASAIDPAEMNDDTDYMRAAQVLPVDYVLVGKFDKIGDFVLTNFRVFPSPKGTQGQYEAGKILDMLVQEEIPKIGEMIRRDIASTVVTPDTTSSEKTEPEPRKKWPTWRLFALGGAAVGGVTAIVLLGGSGGGKPPDEGLPRPPRTP